MEEDDIDPEHFLEPELYDPSEADRWPKAVAKPQNVLNRERSRSKDRRGLPVLDKRKVPPEDMQQLRICVPDDEFKGMERPRSLRDSPLPLFPTPPLENMAKGISEPVELSDVALGGVLDYRLLLDALGISGSPFGHCGGESQGSGNMKWFQCSSPNSYREYPDECAPEHSKTKCSRRPNGSLMDFFDMELEPEVRVPIVFKRLESDADWDSESKSEANLMELEEEEISVLSGMDIDRIRWSEHEVEPEGNSGEAESELGPLNAGDIDRMQWPGASDLDVKDRHVDDFVEDGDGFHRSITPSRENRKPLIQWPAMDGKDDEKYKLTVEEKQDNLDPEWKHFRAKSDEELFWNARHSWCNSTVPNLRLDLTQQNFRSSQHDPRRRCVDEMLQMRTDAGRLGDHDGKREDVARNIEKLTCAEFVDGHLKSDLKLRNERRGWDDHKRFRKKAYELSVSQWAALSVAFAQRRFKPSEQVKELKLQQEDEFRRLRVSELRHNSASCEKRKALEESLERCRGEIVGINRLYGQVKLPGTKSYCEQGIDRETVVNMEETENMYLFYESFYPD